MAFIEMRNIVKEFGSIQVLRGVDLSLEKGQVMSIIGPSGAGKSTFLRCLNHLETIQRGSICVNGRYIAKEEKGKNSIFFRTGDSRYLFYNGNGISIF